METLGNLRRTRYCGEVSLADAGQEMTVCGSIARARDKGGIIFADLRDTTGILQLVFDEDTPKEVFAKAESLKSEYVVICRGKLRERAAKTDKIATGDVELYVAELRILSEAQTPPFEIRDEINVNDDLRLRYRYLDLRRPSMHEPIVLRSKIMQIIRSYFTDNNFTEIETPTLIKSTPEGARDYLVPSRVQPGHFYALPQSPQLYKQILMLSGFDRYFQIARCYRDEDFRADRQPEFTQLDVEMSFVDQEDVIALAEEILTEVWSTAGYEVQTPFPRMTYADAMRLYGSDKPDLRFDIQITECTEFFKDTTFRVFQNEYVGAVVMDGGASQPRRQLDAWQEWAKQRGAKGLAYILVGEDGELSGPVAKNITDDERAGIADHVGAKPGDCIFFAAGDTKSSRGLLGAARGEIAQKLGLIDDTKWAFTWVVDAPMFEPAADARAEGDVALGNSAWTAVHHAFTSPKPEFLDSFDQDPGSALAYAYDIVCNGNEIGGGSIRIHQRDVQERVFQVMGISQEEAREKFGFLLDAFAFGAPPHGGIAFGWDRIVSLLGGFDSIRDVIAFPKSGGGVDPLTDAPSEITPEQRKESGIDAKPKKAAAAQAGAAKASSK